MLLAKLVLLVMLFKVYLTRFVIICHSSASEWLFNVSGVKPFSLLQGLLANAMLSALCIVFSLL